MAPRYEAEFTALANAVDALVAAAPTAAAADATALRWAATRCVLARAHRDGAQLQLDASAADRDPDHHRALAALAAVAAAAAAPLAVPSFAWLGSIYPRLLAPIGRKRAGAWFTAPALTEPTVRRTLAPLHLRGAPLRIVDPAMGAGAFLLAALAARVAAGRPAAAVATEELFGRDIDPTAADLTAAAVHEACGAEAPPLAAIRQNLACGDGLLDLADDSFDAVLGNPPWETLQTARAEAGSTELARRLVERVAALRRRFADQGRGKLYTYRLFLERALQLLRAGGRLGLIVPASLYFDRDAAPLRERLLGECRWEWLFAFENRRRLFAIDGRYRFGPIIAEKGEPTSAVRVAFGRSDVREWAEPTPPHLEYRAEDLRALSPRSGAFVEVADRRDLELMRRMTAAGVPLLGDAGACTWRQGDFNMTSDRASFRDRAACERDGFAPQPDGTWRRPGDAAVLRPLYQGAMVHDLCANAGAFAGGVGRATRWRPPANAVLLEPQYLVDAALVRPTAPARVALRALSNATNERTAIACLLADEPCGNSLGMLAPRRTATPVLDAAFTAGVLASLAWDWLLRLRLAGTNVNGFVLADMVLPRVDAASRRTIAALALQAGTALPWHEPLRRRAAAEGVPAAAAAPDRATARALLDVAVARAFGLLRADLDWILRDCDHPSAALADRTFARALDPKGFWRVDRALPPAERLPLRIRAAFAATA